MSDYATLQADIADWLARDTLTAQIPSFIRLSEARHHRDLRLQSMMRRARTMGVGSQYIALPPDYLDMRRLRLVAESTLYDLTQVTPDAFKVRANGGRPTTYCVHREIELDAPTSESLEMVYYAPFAPLSVAEPTNWLLTNAEDVYLYGSLLQAEPYLRNDERVPLWAAAYQTAIDALEANDARGRVNRGGQRFSVGAMATP